MTKTEIAGWLKSKGYTEQEVEGSTPLMFKKEDGSTVFLHNDVLTLSPHSFYGDVFEIEKIIVVNDRLFYDIFS